jgi:poly(hydroxyalkanoate) depolymerase family esterase
MNAHIPDGMAEATRLTRAGRLVEATALIRRLIGAAPPRDARDAVALPPPPEPSAPPVPRRRFGLRETLRRLAERARALDVGDPALAPPAPDGARFEAGRHVGPEGARDYKLYVPASARDAGPRPMVVMLHGCGQNPDDFARGTGMNAAAEEAGVLVLYPAQSLAANPKRCWNWFRPEDQSRDGGEPALIAGLVRAVTAAEAVDPARVFVAGLSAGGAAAAVLGDAYPELFAAVGVHSGLPRGAARDAPSAFAAMRSGAPGAAAARPVRTIVFHGDADHVVNPANADALVAQAAAGAEAGRVERGAAGGRRFSRSVRHDARGRTLTEQWMLHGAAHAWSGGDAEGSHADPLGPDASREMLRFFLER